jgi:DNA-binding transcriptional regulator of glucitol operon
MISVREDGSGADSDPESSNKGWIVAIVVIILLCLLLLGWYLWKRIRDSKVAKLARAVTGNNGKGSNTALSVGAAIRSGMKR